MMNTLDRWAVKHTDKATNKGFALGEMVATVAIIGTLAAAGTPAYMGMVQKAENAKSMIDIKEAAKMLNIARAVDAPASYDAETSTLTVESDVAGGLQISFTPNVTVYSQGVANPTKINPNSWCIQETGGEVTIHITSQVMTHVEGACPTN